MTVYKYDDRIMINALSDYLSSDVSCDECPISELCEHNSDLACYDVFKMWLLKEVGGKNENLDETRKDLHG